MENRSNVVKKLASMLRKSSKGRKKAKVSRDITENEYMTVGKISESD